MSFNQEKRQNVKEVFLLIYRSEHKIIDVDQVSKFIESKFKSLKYIYSFVQQRSHGFNFRNRKNFLQNLKVEQEIEYLNDNADRQLRLLKPNQDKVK